MMFVPLTKLQWMHSADHKSHRKGGVPIKVAKKGKRQADK